MKNMLASHAEALESQNVLYHTFLQEYDASKKIIYGFVEGRDDPSFYKYALRHIIQNCSPEFKDNLKPAGNKSKVIQLFNAFNWDNFDKRKILFFIDRDLECFCNAGSITAPNIFITDGYSVENYVVNSVTFLDMLEDLYNPRNFNSVNKAEIEIFFNARHKEFCVLMLEIMSWLITWRQEGVDLHLEKLKLDKLLVIEPTAIKIVQKIPDFLTELFGTNFNSCINTQKEIIAHLQTQAPKSYIVGKYELSFFLKLLEYVYSNISLFSEMEFSRPRSNLGERNAMEYIAPRVSCPEDLRKFINATAVSYINEKVVNTP